MLRKEWGFKGVTVSDYYAIKEVQTKYKYAATPAEDARDCIDAGTNMDLPLGGTYNVLPKAMAEGTIPQSLVDQSVRRVLMLKFKLGLMNSPNTGETAATYDINSQDNRNRA